jgi:hypothetical protein
MKVLTLGLKICSSVLDRDGDSERDGCICIHSIESLHTIFVFERNHAVPIIQWTLRLELLLSIGSHFKPARSVGKYTSFICYVRMHEIVLSDCNVKT